MELYYSDLMIFFFPSTSFYSFQRGGGEGNDDTDAERFCVILRKPKLQSQIGLVEPKSTKLPSTSKGLLTHRPKESVAESFEIAKLKWLEMNIQPWKNIVQQLSLLLLPHLGNCYYPSTKTIEKHVNSILIPVHFLGWR